MPSHCSVNVHVHNNLYINMLIPLQERLHVCLQLGGGKKVHLLTLASQNELENISWTKKKYQEINVMHHDFTHKQCY